MKTIKHTRNANNEHNTMTIDANTNTNYNTNANKTNNATNANNHTNATTTQLNYIHQ